MLLDQFDITATAGGSGNFNPDPGTPMAALVSNGTHVVFYISGSNIHALEYTPTTQAWQDSNLTAITGGPQAFVGNTGLTCIVAGANYVLFYIGNGDIHALTFNGSWSDQDLTTAVPGSEAPSGSLSSFWRSANSSQHLYYTGPGPRGQHGQISEFVKVGTSAWSVNSLPTSQGYCCNADLVFAFLDANGKNAFFDELNAPLGDNLWRIYQPFNPANPTTGTPVTDGTSAFPATSPVLSITGIGGYSPTAIPEYAIYTAWTNGGSQCHIYAYSVANNTTVDVSESVSPPIIAYCNSVTPLTPNITSFLF